MLSCDIHHYRMLNSRLKMLHSGCALVWHFQPRVGHIWMSNSLPCIICLMLPLLAPTEGITSWTSYLLYPVGWLMQYFLLHEQQWAASLIVRNAVKWHSSLFNAKHSVENVALRLRPCVTFSTSGSSYLDVELITMHHLSNVALADTNWGNHQLNLIFFLSVKQLLMDKALLL